MGIPRHKDNMVPDMVRVQGMDNHRSQLQVSLTLQELILLINQLLTVHQNHLQIHHRGVRDARDARDVRGVRGVRGARDVRDVHGAHGAHGARVHGGRRLLV
jgi:hypothetical protein